MKKKRAVVYGFLFLLFFCFSCANDSEEDLTDQIQIPLLVTYTNSVKAIIDNNCIICHNNPPVNGAPFSLLEYNDVKTNVAGIINRISRQEGEFGLMPAGGPPLPQNLIDLVEQWESDGLLE